MRWFRFWTEAMHKPKIRRLSHPLYRFWTYVLCIASESEPWGTLPPIADVADLTRMSVAKASGYMRDLETAGLVDVSPDGTVRPHGWDRWQKPSDSSSNRVKAFRERSVTVTETVPEQNRTDTEQKQSRTDAPNSRRRRDVSPVEMAQASADALREETAGRLVQMAIDRFSWRLTKTRLGDEWRMAGELLEVWDEDTVARAIQARRKLSSLRWLADFIPTMNGGNVAPRLKDRPAILDEPPPAWDGDDALAEENRAAIAEVLS